MEMFNKDDLIEKASDAGLDKLEKFATEKLGADTAEQARDAADERIGNRGADRAPEQQQAPEATPEQPEQ